MDNIFYTCIILSICEFWDLLWNQLDNMKMWYKFSFARVNTRAIKWMDTVSNVSLIGENSYIHIFLSCSVIYIHEKRLLSWFHVDSRNLNPRFIHFWSVFHTRQIFSRNPLWWHWYQTMWSFLAHLLIYVKNISHHVHLLQRLRKCLKDDF